MTIDLGFEEPTDEYIEDLICAVEKFGTDKPTLLAGTIMYALIGIYTPVSDVLKYALKLVNYENSQAVNYIQTTEHVVSGLISVISAIGYIFVHKNFRRGVKEGKNICEHFEVRERLGDGYALNDLK